MQIETAEMHSMKAGVIKGLPNKATAVTKTVNEKNVTFTVVELELLNNPTSIEGHIQKAIL